MHAYNTSNLEDVLYLICHKLNVTRNDPKLRLLEEEKKQNNKELVKYLPNLATLEQINVERDQSWEKQVAISIRSLYIVYKRTWKLYMSEHRNLFALTLFPLLMVCMYNLQFWKLPSLNVAVINADTEYNNISLAKELLQAISSSGQAMLVNKFFIFLSINFELI